VCSFAGRIGGTVDRGKLHAKWDIGDTLSHKGVHRFFGNRVELLNGHTEPVWERPRGQYADGVPRVAVKWIQLGERQDLHREGMSILGGQWVLNHRQNPFHVLYRVTPTDPLKRIPVCVHQRPLYILW